jgi:hypothetical protein
MKLPSLSRDVVCIKTFSPRVFAGLLYYGAPFVPQKKNKKKKKTPPPSSGQIWNYP